MPRVLTFNITRPYMSAAQTDLAFFLFTFLSLQRKKVSPICLCLALHAVVASVQRGLLALILAHPPPAQLHSSLAQPQPLYFTQPHPKPNNSLRPTPLQTNTSHPTPNQHVPLHSSSPLPNHTHPTPTSPFPPISNLPHLNSTQPTRRPPHPVSTST